MNIHRMLSWLITTKAHAVVSFDNEGLTYSPKDEETFNAVYALIESSGEKAPLPAEVPQSVTGRNQLKEVEEAMETLDDAANVAYLPDIDDPDILKEFDKTQAALAVIRAALALREEKK